MDRLQPVLNAAARSVYNSRKYDRISPPLRDLHWLRVPERIKFCLAVLVLTTMEEDVGLSVGAAWIAGQDRSMWRTLRPSAGQAQQ